MHTKTRKEVLNENRRAQIERVLARCSEVNRERLRCQVEECRGKLHQERSILNFVNAVVKGDGILGGKDFRAFTVEDARRVVSAFRLVYNAESLRTRVIGFRMHIRWLFEVDRLDEQGSACPNGKAIERALNVPRPRGRVVGQVISREHQDLLVQSVEATHSLNPPFPVQLRDRWFLRGLKGTGHRVSEFCSIQLRGVKFQMMTVLVQGVPVSMEVMWVDMDERAPDLKTGRRGIFTADAEAIQACKDWLMAHPAAGLNERPKPGWDGARDTLDPDAPLNVRANCKRIEAIAPSGIAKVIIKACRKTGLDRILPAMLTPHDFRHTAATEDARSGSTEADLRQKYGWGPDSKMPAHYVHLRVEDMAARAIRNAHQAAAPTPAAQPAAVDALVRLLQQAMGRGDAVGVGA